MSAEDRREQVLSAAVIEFASGGLEGTSTDAIARRAGISQPYLFRLYSTKKALFVAAVERTFLRCVETFRGAAEGLTGEAAKEAMGAAYTQLLSDRTFLQMQMQAYAGCADPEVRDATRAGFDRLWDEAVILTGLPDDRIHEFFAHGMLLNVAASMGLDLDCGDELSVRLLGGEKAAELAGALRSATADPRDPVAATS
jgi:AcrR family transcriptional regulator